MYEPGFCGCYEGYECYADCDCSNCLNFRGRHLYGGIIINGQRYFRVMDFRPNDRLKGKTGTTHYAEGPVRKAVEPLETHPEALIARHVTD